MCFMFKAFERSFEGTERSFEGTECSFEGFERKFGAFEYAFFRTAGIKILRLTNDVYYRLL